MLDFDRAIELHYKERKQDWIVIAVSGMGILLGCVLLVLGITGSVELEVGAEDFKGKLVNASPGVVIAVLGFFVVGIQAWRRPKATWKDPQSGSLELHESGPVILFSDGLSIRLSRPTDRDPRGDHWYGEPFDTMLEELAQSPLERRPEVPGPHAQTGPVNIESTIAPLITAWCESASQTSPNPYVDKSGRNVEINIGGEHSEWGTITGGHTYSGKLAGDQVKLVMALMHTLAESNRE